MDNNIGNFENYEQLPKRYIPINDYYQNYDYNNEIKNNISPMDLMMYDIYKNGNINKDILLNNKSEHLKYMNSNKFNDDYINNDKYNYIINRNNNNINNKYYKNNNTLDEDKKRLREEERQKKLQYQQMLDEQIREKRIRDEQEKEKRLQEELFYEEKYRLEQQQQQLNLYQNEREIKNMLNKESIDNPLYNNNYHFRQNNMQTLNYEDNVEQKGEEFEQEYDPNLMVDLSQNVNENNQIYNNIYSQLYMNNQNPTPPTIENLVSTSAQMPNLNINRVNSQGFRTQNYYYPQQSSNYFLSQKMNPYMTQNNNYDYPPKNNLDIQKNISSSPYQMQLNTNRMMNSSPNIINASQSNQFGNNNINFNGNNSQNMNEIYNMNISNQNYIGKMMELFFNEQNKIIESYKETIRQLKNERDEALIKNKANEEKLKALKNLQKFQKKYDKMPFKNEFNQDLDNFLSTIQKDELNINNPKGEISILSDSKLPPLLTSTKLVKQNPNENILETWKKEEKEKENGKKLEFNGMDTNYMMNKISQIKNTILEKSNISHNINEKDKNCMIDISLISKTNEEKSNNNNDLGNDSEFHIENNEDLNTNNHKEKQENSFNDSVEIISNRNAKCISINDEEDKKKENHYKNNIKEDIHDYKEDKIDDIIPQNNMSQSKNIINNNNIALFNIDNNISSSAQLKQREFYLNKNKEINLQKITPFIFNNNKSKDENNILNIKNNSKDNLEIKKSPENNNNNINNEENIKDNYNLLQKGNYVIENNEIIENNKYNDLNDFPNIDSPKETYHTIQTFNPNKNKNIESTKNKNTSNKKEETINKEKQDIIMKQINFFDDTSLISNNKKSKTKKEQINKVFSSNNNISQDNNNINNNDGNYIRPSYDLNNNQINSLNNFYEDYKKKKSNNYEDTVNMNNSLKESSILNESLNTFTQNLNIKWKDMKKDDIPENNNNNDNIKEGELSKIEEDKKDDLDIFNKVNQFTRLANDELEHSQLAIFNKENTIDKFDQIARNNH